MMDALQRYFQQFRGVPDAATSLATINQQFGFLDLSGAYKTREVPVGDAIVTRDVHLALIPVRDARLNETIGYENETP